MKNYVSIENCLNVVPNKFELSLLVSNRAKSILNGAPSHLDYSYNANEKKASYIALEEIEGEKLDIASLKRDLKDELLRDNLFIKISGKKDLLKSDLSSNDNDDNFDLDELMDSMEFDDDIEDSIEDDAELEVD